MYTNTSIPTNDIISLVRTILKHHNTQQKTINEIINITNTILLHNYFQFDNTYYRQEEGLAMGSPSSAILAEIYLQYTECVNIYDILQKHYIIGYFRYVDDAPQRHKKINKQKINGPHSRISDMKLGKSPMYLRTQI
jgi:hypothetical protein